MTSAGQAGVRDDEAVARALSAFVREEFEAPIARLRLLIDALAEELAAQDLDDYASDAGKMQAAGARLAQLVGALLDGSLPAEMSEPSKLRHDLRSPVASVVGYAELMAEEATDRGDTIILEPLADLLEAAGRLLGEIDRLVGEWSAMGQADAPRPDVMRRAVDVITRLSRDMPAAPPQVRGRVLVVDDNPSARDLVGRRLTRDGHEVTSCASGLEALDVARRKPFDLMLLDLMMPGLDGLEVLSRLRAHPRTRTLPVIVVSALDDVSAAVRCIAAGADDFLSKPIDETLLRARIGSSLERKFLRDREQDALQRLQAERARADALLLNVLPVTAVERLHAGETVIADHFDDVSVMFADLVGFTALSAQLTPIRTLDLLNEIFSRFDELAETFGLEKIKTIGDAYMAVGGVSEPTADHARRTVEMGSRIAPTLARVIGGAELGVRVGIDTGPAVGGIIGRRKFFYDLWGDTVNTASRLEASCEPGRVHVSTETRAAAGGDFDFEPREPMPLKGKGVMQTFYVGRTA